MKNNDDGIARKDFIARFNAMLEIGSWFYDALERGELQIADGLFLSFQEFMEEFEEVFQNLSWKDLDLKRQKGQEKIPFDELIKIKDLMLKCAKGYKKNVLEELSLSFSLNEKHLLGIQIEVSKVGYNINIFKRTNDDVNPEAEGKLKQDLKRQKIN